MRAMRLACHHCVVGLCRAPRGRMNSALKDHCSLLCQRLLWLCIAAGASAALTVASFCRKTSSATVSDSKLRILAIDPRLPGSTHDAFCWKHSFLRRRIAEQGLLRPGEFLLGDSGYPLEPWLMTPVPGHPSLQTPEGAYNHAHSSMRTAVERCIGVLKSRFRCLQRYRTLHYSPKRSATIIAACAALHNLCLEEGDPFDGSCSSDDNSDSEDSEQEHDTAAQNVPPPSTRSTLTKAKAVRCRIVHLFSLPRLQHTAYLRRVRQRVIRQLARQRRHTSQ
ncbi:uncharacterized protein LOC144128023 isoform X1 [Amblyomma americanum]